MVEISKAIEQNKKREFERRQREKNSQQGSAVPTDNNIATTQQLESQQDDTSKSSTDDDIEEDGKETEKPKPAENKAANPYEKILYPHERELIRFIVKYGMVDFCDAVDAEGNTFTINLLQYVANELEIDQMTFSNSLFAHIFDESIEVSEQFNDVFNHFYTNARSRSDARKWHCRHTIEATLNSRY